MLLGEIMRFCNHVSTKQGRESSDTTWLALFLLLLRYYCTNGGCPGRRGRVLLPDRSNTPFSPLFLNVSIRNGILLILSPVMFDSKYSTLHDFISSNVSLICGERLGAFVNENDLIVERL